MNREKLTSKLEEQLKCLIWDVMKCQPDDGIVDLTLTITSVDEEDETLTIVKVTTELVELTDGTWIVEDYQTTIKTHDLYPEK